MTENCIETYRTNYSIIFPETESSSRAQLDQLGQLSNSPLNLTLLTCIRTDADGAGS